MSAEPTFTYPYTTMNKSIPMKMTATFVLSLSLLAAGFSAADKPLTPATGKAQSAQQPPMPAQIARYIAIDNVCAWPQLTVLRDGTMAAIIYNQANHGTTEADAECWTSKDGDFWRKAGVAARHEPNTNRMLFASGLAKNGDLLMLCGGYTNEKKPQHPKSPASFREARLRSWVCRSSDGGRNWTQQDEFVAPEKGWTEFIPFGPIVAGEDGALHASCYAAELTDRPKSTRTKGYYRAWHFRSDDDGKTWRPTSIIGIKHNETALFHLGGKRWLAAARASSVTDHGDGTDLFRSDDDGATWQDPQRVTGHNEVNAHVVRLKDGRLLLSYGIRVKDQHGVPGQFGRSAEGAAAAAASTTTSYGVLAKLSSDEGKTWSEPLRLAHSLLEDCGYPSSVQRADGKVVTVYYSKGVENHERYHMGVAIWEVPAR